MNDPSKQAPPGLIAPAGELIISDTLEDYYQRTRENLRKSLPVIAARLQCAGVAHVRVEYDGCGDSGQIEHVELLDVHGQVMALDPALGVEQEALTQLFYDLIEARYGGWENNDGAFGALTWELTTNGLHHTHHARFTDYDTSEYEGL